MVKLLLPYVEEHEQFKRAVDSLRKYTPSEVEIVLIHDKERRGMSTVFNDYFTGEDDLILWHADMYATEGWYEKLMSYNNFDITGMKLVYPNGLIQHYGGFLRKIPHRPQYGIGFHPHQFCLDLHFDKPMESAFVTWGGCYIKKEVIQAVGKLDEKYIQAYYGDVDYCFTAHQKGFKVGVVPVTIIHEESLDTKKNQEELDKILAHNESYFMAKWMDVLSSTIKLLGDKK